jgi:hypothetical protein
VQALHPTMTKCIHAVKAKKILHWSNKQIKLSLAPTHAKVSGLAPTRRMCRDFIGNWNYEQCFPAGNQGRKLLKKLDKRRVDIIYIRGNFWQRTVANSNWQHFSLLTHGGHHPSWAACIHFLNAKNFSDHRKLQVQDSRSNRITLLRTSNLEHCESTSRQEKHQQSIQLQQHAKFSAGSTENFNQPQLFLLARCMNHPRRTTSILSLNLSSYPPSKSFTVVASMQGVECTSSPLADICIQEFARNFYQGWFPCHTIAVNLLAHV